jgi:hypothetical protein
MQLSELLGCTVRDAGSHEVGTVVDVRLNVAGDLDDSPSAPTLFGLIVSPRTRSSYLGYERSEVNRPMALAAWLRWRHRGTFLALWQDVGAVEPRVVRLRAGFHRYSPILRTD